MFSTCLVVNCFLILSITNKHVTVCPLFSSVFIDSFSFHSVSFLWMTTLLSQRLALWVLGVCTIPGIFFNWFWYEASGSSSRINFVALYYYTYPYIYTCIYILLLVYGHLLRPANWYGCLARYYYQYCYYFFSFLSFLGFSFTFIIRFNIAAIILLK